VQDATKMQKSLWVILGQEKKTERRPRAISIWASACRINTAHFISHAFAATGLTSDPKSPAGHT